VNKEGGFGMKFDKLFQAWQKKREITDAELEEILERERPRRELRRAARCNKSS